MKTKLLVLCLLFISLATQAQWHVFDKTAIPLRDSIVNNADYIIIGVKKWSTFFDDSITGERYCGAVFEVHQILRGSKQLQLGTTIQIILGKEGMELDGDSVHPDKIVRTSKKWTMLFCDSAEFTAFFPKASNPLKLKVCHGEASIRIVDESTKSYAPLAGLRGMYFRNRAALFFWLKMKYSNIHFSQDDYYTKPTREEKRAVKEKEAALKRKKAEEDALRNKKQQEDWDRMMQEKMRMIEERKKASGFRQTNSNSLFYALQNPRNVADSLGERWFWFDLAIRSDTDSTYLDNALAHIKYDGGAPNQLRGRYAFCYQYPTQKQPTGIEGGRKSPARLVPSPRHYL